MLVQSTIPYPIQWRSIKGWGLFHSQKRLRLNDKDVLPPPTSNRKQIGMHKTDWRPPPCKQPVVRKNTNKQKQKTLNLVCILNIFLVKILTNSSIIYLFLYVFRCLSYCKVTVHIIKDVYIVRFSNMHSVIPFRLSYFSKQNEAPNLIVLYNVIFLCDK